MKRSIFTGLAVLGVAIATAAHAQLIRVAFNTTHIDGDFYEYNIASPDPYDENGYLKHHVHPIAGSLHFETVVDLAAAASPGEPRIFDFRLWGDIDVLGHLDIAPFGLVVKHLPNGAWSIESPPRDYVSGPLIFEASLGLNPDLSPEGAAIYFRVYGDPEYAQYIFQGGPGFYSADTSVWTWTNADEMTATPVQGPPMTPVPEPATTSSIAALGLCGLLGWRRWRAR